jgi:hypothetical protein
MNVFEAVKENVTTRQAAELYGIKVNRNGMAVCPFHNDKNPSMKVDRRFHCFGCQADGDVIDFAGLLYGISSKEAAQKLAADFGIVCDGKRRALPMKIKKKMPEELRFQKAIQKCFRVFTEYLHLLKRWANEFAPKSPDEEWHPLFVEALQRKSYVEYLLDTLLLGTIEDKAALIVEHGKEVKELERRITIFTSGDQKRSA